MIKFDKKNYILDRKSNRDRDLFDLKNKSYSARRIRAISPAHFLPLEIYIEDHVELLTKSRLYIRELYGISWKVWSSSSLEEIHRVVAEHIKIISMRDHDARIRSLLILSHNHWRRIGRRFILDIYQTIIKDSQVVRSRRGYLLDNSTNIFKFLIFQSDIELQAIIHAIQSGWIDFFFICLSCEFIQERYWFYWSDHIRQIEYYTNHFFLSLAS